MKNTPLDLEKLMCVPYVEMNTGYDISPDGSQIAFSWNKTGHWELYTVASDGRSDPVKITRGSGSKSAPHWSPDGKRLAYVVDFDGGEVYDINILDLESNHTINLTPNTPFEILANYCWSPDGKQIAFGANREGLFDVYVISSMGGVIKKMLTLTFPYWEVDWSPDGRFLAVVSEARGQDYWTYIVPLEDGRPKIISIDEKPICAKDASWSPDSRYLAFASNHRGRFDIGVYEVAAGEISWLTEGEARADFPVWSPDGQQIAFMVGYGASTVLAIYHFADRAIDEYQIADGVHYYPKYSHDGKTILTIFDNPQHSSDLWSFSIQEKSFHQITHSMPDELKSSQFVMPEEVEYPSFDGELVPALLYTPPRLDRPAPAVIYVHGGPNWLTQITWDPTVQHMVSRGWVVLAPNYRGSAGYGRSWQLANRFDLGGVDTDDVTAGVDYLLQKNLAIPGKIAVTGSSWGGYLTMTCLTQYPDRWAAGSALAPFLNWFTGHVNSREDLRHWDIENFGTAEDNYDLWYERSPYFFLDRIQVPVQLICGEHDVRCPASESVLARNELLRLGKICDYVLYPDEGHVFLKTENQVDSKLKRVEFLARYLEKNHHVI